MAYNKLYQRPVWVIGIVTALSPAQTILYGIVQGSLTHMATLWGDRQAPVRSHHRLYAAVLSLPLWDLSVVCALPAHLRRHAPDARAQRHAIVALQLHVPHRLVMTPASFACLHCVFGRWLWLRGSDSHKLVCCAAMWPVLVEQSGGRATWISQVCLSGSSSCARNACQHCAATLQAAHDAATKWRSLTPRSDDGAGAEAHLCWSVLPGWSEEG